MGRGSLDVPRQKLRLMNYHEGSVAEQHRVKIVLRNSTQSADV